MDDLISRQRVLDIIEFNRNSYDGGQEEYYILAWMPLPKPYKKEGE